MAQSFGATVTMTTPEHRLFFLVGRDRLPTDVVARYGGRVVFSIPDTTKILAILPVSVHHLVEHHPNVALCGPVTINQERFARFLALVGLDNGSENDE